MNKNSLIVGACLGTAAACHAGANNYGEAAATYKAEMKADDPSLVNPGFLGNLAASQAKRKARNIDTSGGGGGNDDTDLWLASRGGLHGDNSFNFASPTITGTVRGDVTIVVQRGAVRGSVTSIRR